MRTDRGTRRHSSARVLLLGSAAAALLAAAGLAASQDAERELAEGIAGAQPENGASGNAGTDDLDNTFEIGPFAEPIDINAFVDIVAETLGINVTKDPALSGQIAFNSSLTLTRRDLLPLLDLRLEELGFTITRDPLGFFTIRRPDQIVLNPGTEPGSTTRFIPTPGLRPSALGSVIGTQLTVSKISYEDELGVIIITDTPRKIAQLESLVAAMIEQRNSLVTEAIPLTYISAPVALQRAIERLGGAAGGSPLANLQQQAQRQTDQSQALSAGSGNGLTNIAQRLSTDPAGNSLIFRGLPEELEHIRDIIASVDRVNELISKKYFTGSATSVIADLAERQGFGRVIEAAQPQQNNNFFNVNRFQEQVNNQFSQSSDSDDAGGSQLLVDQSEGMITYFGTPEQQASFNKLIVGFATDDEFVVIVPYKLQYSDAADVASILQSLIDRSRPQGEDNAFLPQNQQAAARQFQPFFDPTTPQSLGDGEVGVLSDDAFVIGDEPNNQVFVRAPRSQQETFEKLISQIDLRRSQVYIEATIIAVSDTDDFRLAIEGAFNDIDGSGNGAGVQTNFGLSSAGSTFTDPRVIATGLGGVTASIIRSDFVPVIINATKSDTNNRVVATPQLLVDDNALAEVQTSQEVPFQTTSQGDATTLTSFEFATATTSLTVTPQISSDGTVRLDYTVSLESFTGPAVGGAPPPRQTNNLNSESVTVPNGGTVVIGGLGLSSEGDTIIKVPLLGDIPIFGHLFRDTTRNSSDTKLYVFLTPRVLRDPSLQDYRLISLGPFADVDLPDYIPTLDPTMIKSSLVMDEPSDGFVLPSDRNPARDQQMLRPEQGDAPSDEQE